MGLHEKYAKQGFLELVDVFTKEEAAKIYSGYTDYVEKYVCEDQKETKKHFWKSLSPQIIHTTDTEVRFGREGCLEGDFR